MATLGTRITSSSNVGEGNGGEVRSILLVADSAAATAVLRQNASGGQVIATVRCPIGDSRQAGWDGLTYSGQLHCTLSGAGAEAVIEL